MGVEGKEKNHLHGAHDAMIYIPLLGADGLCELQAKSSLIVLSAKTIYKQNNDQ